MATLPSGLPDFVGNEEDLARFLTQSSHFNSLMPKPAAFLPVPKSRETSVSRHGSGPLSQLRTIGLAAAGARNLYGAAIVNASDLQATALDVFAAEPPDRHAAIRSWPWTENDPELQKAQQKEIAAELASKALLVMKE